VVSEIDGVVTYGGIKRGNREVFIESRDGVQKRYLVPLSKHILVQDNDFRESWPAAIGWLNFTW
jgi:DNA-directed RNA polymerase subunit beta'